MLKQKIIVSSNNKNSSQNCVFHGKLRKLCGYQLKERLNLYILLKFDQHKSTRYLNISEIDGWNGPDVHHSYIN